MASASRFVPLELPLDEFIEEQSNKNAPKLHGKRLVVANERACVSLRSVGGNVTLLLRYSHYNGITCFPEVPG